MSLLCDLCWYMIMALNITIGIRAKSFAFKAIFWFWLKKKKKTIFVRVGWGLKCPFFPLVFWLSFDNFLSLRMMHRTLLWFFGNFWKSFAYMLDRFSELKMAVRVWIPRIFSIVFWIKMRPWIHLKLDLEQNPTEITMNGGRSWPFQAGHPRGSGSGRNWYSGEDDEPDDVVFSWNGQTTRRSTGSHSLHRARKRHVVSHGKTTCRSEIAGIYIYI